MDPVFWRLLGVVLLLAAIAALGRWSRRGAGRIERLVPAGTTSASTAASTSGAARRVETPVTEDERRMIGLDTSDAEVAALLFSAGGCSACRQVQGLLGELGEELAAEGRALRWVTVDTTVQLELAQAHRVLRVPTLLVLTADGQVVARSGGVPRREELRAVLREQAGLGVT